MKGVNSKNTHKKHVQDITKILLGVLCFDFGAHGFNMFFERSREPVQRKKFDNLVLNWCDDKTNLNPARSAPNSLVLMKQQ